MDAALARLHLDGHSTKGRKIIDQHYNAVLPVSNCVKTTLGPCGMNKLMIDETGETIISNDGNSILQLLRVDNPISKLVIDLAQEQDREVGDGTTSCVLIVAELVKACKNLMARDIHSSTIISGLKYACTEATKFLRNHHAFPVNADERETILNVAKTSISSKILSDNPDFFANMCLDAVLAVKGTKTSTYLIDMIAKVKSVGRSIDDSTLFNGFALNCVKLARDMPYVVEDAKIACIGFGLKPAQMKMGVQVLVSDSNDLESIRAKEIEMGANIVRSIIDSGANVVLCSAQIAERYGRIFTAANVMGVQFVDPKDLQKIAQVTGASLIKSVVGHLDSNNGFKFDKSLLGHAGKVSQERFADNECIMISDTKAHASASLVIRGPTPAIIEEVSRSMHDCICAIKHTLETQKLVAGAGCAEAAISVHLENLALKIDSREQIVVSEFAQAMKVIPMQLAMNAGADATEIVGNLISAHSAAQKDSSAPQYMGLDLKNRCLFDARKGGVFDPLVSKVKQLRKATEAAMIIAKVDNVVRNNPSKADSPHDGHDEF